MNKVEEAHEALVEAVQETGGSLILIRVGDNELTSSGELGECIDVCIGGSIPRLANMLNHAMDIDDVFRQVVEVIHHVRTQS